MPLRVTLLLTALIALTACGGGGGGGSMSSAAGNSVQPGAHAATGLTVTSEADALLHMDQLRASGFRGAGVRVGVISTGVVNLASYQSAGVLPAGIYVSKNTAGTLDEGSWMLELVHQHAPDAVLGFCAARSTRQARSVLRASLLYLPALLALLLGERF